VIRFHIKGLVLAWLASLTDPTADEWRVVSPLLLDPENPVFDHAWNLLFREAWFGVADAEGAFERLLRHENSQIVDRAVSVLRSNQRERPARVAELLEPFVNESDDWNRRLVGLVQWANLATNRRFFELALHLIDAGVLDNARGAIARNSDFWDVGYGLEERAQWAVEYLERYLTRQLDVANERGVTNPFDRAEGTIPDATHNEQFFIDTAEAAPEEFANRILPFVLRVAAATAEDEHENERLRRDPVWSYRYRSDRFGVAGALLAGLERALQLFAAKAPARFARLATKLGDSQLETANFLAVRGFLGAPEKLAHEAAAYLLEEPLRLRAGYLDDDHWAARELIAASFAHLPETARSRMEEFLTSYETPWERSAGGYRARGHSRFTLLSGLPEGLLSDSARRELEELRRKFRRAEPAPPQGIGGGFVGSPIPPAAAEKMTDSQWLRAIARYRGDREWREIGGTLRGDAEELAHELERLTKDDPARFAALAERIPDDAHTAYFDAILRGVASSEAMTADVALQVCRRCHALPGRPCGRWITQPVDRIASEPLSEELIEITEWYASNDPDPQKEIWRVTPDGAQRPYYGGDIYTAGINSVRGAAAGTVAQLVSHDGGRVDRLSRTIARLAADPSLAVRACSARVLLALNSHDPEAAVSLFERLVDAPDELLSTPWVERFLAHATGSFFPRVEPTLARMLDSPLEEVQQAGGRQAVLASICTDDANALAERAATHVASAVRRGAGQVAAANVAYVDAQQHLTAILSKLFDDEDPAVREETVLAFRRLRERPGDEWAELLGAFVSSAAFAEGIHELFFALGDATDPPPQQTAAACARLADHLEAEGDPIAARGVDTDRASQLLLRIYQGAEGDDELRQQALDTIDRLARLQVYGLEDALAAFER
jgi:hypothetical protein